MKMNFFLLKNKKLEREIDGEWKRKNPKVVGREKQARAREIDVSK